MSTVILFCVYLQVILFGFAHQFDVCYHHGPFETVNKCPTNLQVGSDNVPRPIQSASGVSSVSHVIEKPNVPQLITLSEPSPMGSLSTNGIPEHEALIVGDPFGANTEITDFEAERPEQDMDGTGYKDEENGEDLHEPNSSPDDIEHDHEAEDSDGGEAMQMDRDVHNTDNVMHGDVETAGYEVDSDNESGGGGSANMNVDNNAYLVHKELEPKIIEFKEDSDDENVDKDKDETQDKDNKETETETKAEGEVDGDIGSAMPSGGLNEGLDNDKHSFMEDGGAKRIHVHDIEARAGGTDHVIDASDNPTLPDIGTTGQILPAPHSSHDDKTGNAVAEYIVVAILAVIILALVLWCMYRYWVQGDEVSYEVEDESSDDMVNNSDTDDEKQVNVQTGVQTVSREQDEDRIEASLYKAYCDKVESESMQFEEWDAMYKPSDIQHPDVIEACNSITSVDTISDLDINMELPAAMKLRLSVNHTGHQMSDQDILDVLFWWCSL